MFCELVAAQGETDSRIFSFQHAGNITGVNDFAWGLAAGDLDIDGYQDFIVGDSSALEGGLVRIFLNDEGSGNFIEQNPINAEKRPARVALADLDADGFLDAIIVEAMVSARIYPRLLVSYSDGQPLNFLEPEPILTLPGRIYGLTTGDADNDADIDIFVGNQAGRVYLIENQGQGAFGISPVGFDVGRNAYGLASGDIDRDGFLDLVVGDLEGEVEVIYGDGQGIFTRRRYAPIGMLNPLPLGVRGSRQRTVGHSAFGIGVADMNNDGFLDVLIGDGQNALRYFEGSGTSGFELVSTVTKRFSSPYGIALSDYDADGDVDILLGSWGYPDQAPVGLFWNADIKQNLPADDFVTISEGDRFRIYLLVIATTALSALGGTFYFIAKEAQQRRISWKDLVAEVWQIFKISISYATGNIWHMKRRAFNLIIGFAIGAALISSFVHYQEAAPRVAIKDALAERDYEMVIQPGFPWQGHHLLENVSKWLMNERFVEHTEVAYHSMGLFGAYSLPHDYFFGISGFGAYSPTGILISDRESVYIVNETYLDTVADQFNVQGELKVDRETIILSNQLISQINETTGVSLEVGSYFNFSIAGSAPQHPDIGPVYYGNFTPVELTNMKVGGIFSRIPEDSPASLSFTPETLTDSIIVSRNLINYSIEVSLEKTQVLPKLLVRADRQEISKLAPRNVVRSLETLAGILKVEFNSLEVELYTEHLSRKVDRFWETNTAVMFLLVPSVILAGYLSVLCTNLVTRSRSTEVGILKSRGADHWELITIFSLEYGILAIIGTLLGSLLLGVIISASISAFSTNYAIDLVTLSEFIYEVELSPTALIVAFIYSFVVLTAVITRQVRYFMKLDVAEAIQASTRSRGDFVKQWHLDFVASVFFFAIWGFALVNRSYESLLGLSADETQSGFLLLGVLLWFFLAASSGRLVMRILPRLMAWLHIILGSRVKFLTENYSRRGHLVVPILLMFVMTFSIGAFVLETSEIVRSNAENELFFLIGSDCKVISASDTSVNFADTLKAEPGVENVTAVVQTTGDVGPFHVAMMSLDMAVYWEIGDWGKSGLAAGHDYAPVIRILNTMPQYFDLTNDGSLDAFTIEIALKLMARSPSPLILLNEFLAQRLQIEPGETLIIRSIGNAWERFEEFFVLGILEAAPGFGMLNDGGRLTGERVASDGGAVLLSSNILVDNYGFTTTSMFMLSVYDDASLAAINRNLLRHQEVLRVFTTDYAKEKSQDFVRFLGISGIAIVSFASSVIFAILYLSLFLDYIVVERRREYAIMRAAGAKKGEVTSQILFEFLGMLIPGFLVGLALGTIFSVMFVILGKDLFAYSGILSFEISPFTQGTLFLIGVSFFISVIALVIGVTIPARRAARTDVATVLKMV